MSINEQVLVNAIDEALSIVDFESSILNGLVRAVGTDVGFIQICGIGGSPSLPTTLGLEPGIRERLLNPMYEKELQPVKRRALATGGLAIDTEVIADPSRCMYWQDLVRPNGRGHSLFAFLTTQRAVIGGIMLGRHGRSFRDHEMRFVRRVLPLVSAGARAVRAEQALQIFKNAGETPSASLDCLSNREKEILDYLRLGLSNQQIGLALGTSPNTVKNQLARIYFKLDVGCRTEAVAVVMDRLASKASASSESERNISPRDDRACS